MPIILLATTQLQNRCSCLTLSKMDNRKFKMVAFGVGAIALPYAFWWLKLWFFNPSQSRLLKEQKSQRRTITILYVTCTGTARTLAIRLGNDIRKACPVDINVCDVKDFNTDELAKGGIVFLVCSTWTDGRIPESGNSFFDWLQEFAFDFRVSKDHLSKLKFSVFGIGGAVYGENFAKAAREIDEYMLRLEAKHFAPTMYGDDASDLEPKFENWTETIVKRLQDLTGTAESDASNVGSLRVARFDAKKSKFPKKTTVKRSSQSAIDNSRQGPGHSIVKADKNIVTSSQSNAGGVGANAAVGDAAASGGQDLEPEDEEDEEDRINSAFVTMDLDSDSDHDHDHDHDSKVVNASSCGGGDDDGGGVDVEDLGVVMKRGARGPGGAAETGTSVSGSVEQREMVTKLQRKALTKEGYRIIGSHSAVKLCRWTKNQMRGRGGCYKHTFYGITSYQCMEATPSLACANKCVFCWRHHKNPVGTDWRWKTDEPDRIVDEAVELHRGMIREMAGVPGVIPQRLIEANTVRHCALSLVGEPIMYPRINEMLRALHEREISSFLVTNAQFPEKIRDLDPVTQLYVSVDASTKESLKAIDRPLFKDFWERFLGSLEAMQSKPQRTVYRLTLVKDWNMEQLEGYAELIERGQPDFIEIKAMTYCGKSDASSLTMQNVPWHRDVCRYSESIATRLAERGVSVPYSIATEHEHSCCILLAREDKFKVDGVWHTWINYPRFHELMREYYASGGTTTFSSTDYMAQTPEWALYESKEHGFDPIENRWRRAKSGALVENQYKSSDSGCG